MCVRRDSKGSLISSSMLLMLYSLGSPLLFANMPASSLPSTVTPSVTTSPPSNASSQPEQRNLLMPHSSNGLGLSISGESDVTVSIIYKSRKELEIVLIIWHFMKLHNYLLLIMTPLCGPVFFGWQKKSELNSENECVSNTGCQ